MKLPELQSQLHDDVLRARKLEYISRTPEFASAYEKSNQEARTELLRLLALRDPAAVERWMTKTLKSSDQVEELPVIELRILAVRLGITNNRTMSKAALIAAIIKQREYLNDIGSNPTPADAAAGPRVRSQ